MAVRVYEYAAIGYSPFFLVYGVHLKLPSDSTKDLRVRPICERLDEIVYLADARTKANEILLARAIR